MTIGSLVICFVCYFGSRHNKSGLLRSIGQYDKKILIIQKTKTLSKKNQHVTPHQDGWQVKGAGNQKATIVTNNQQQAIEIARQIARIKKTKLSFIVPMG